MSPPPSPVLMVRNVDKRFGQVRVLSGVSLDVDAGEVVAIVGENGAGKSTLVKLLAGVYQPSGGMIFLDGAPVKIASPHSARSLGIATVFQDLPLCDSLDVVDNLFLGREIRPLWVDKASMERQSSQLLQQLSSAVIRVRTKVGALSGGQRQSVSIARSLLGDPAIVVLDEPTASLGRTQRVEVLNQVVRLRERGIAVMMVSHNIEDVGMVADRVVVLRRGRNVGVFDVAKSTPQDVYEAMSGARFDPTTFDRHLRPSSTSRRWP